MVRKSIRTCDNAARMPQNNHVRSRAPRQGAPQQGDPYPDDTCRAEAVRCLVMVATQVAIDQSEDCIRIGNHRGPHDAAAKD